MVKELRRRSIFLCHAFATMQSQATNAFDISQESQATCQMYGNLDYGRQRIMVRRLIERRAFCTGLLR